MSNPFSKIPLSWKSIYINNQLCMHIDLNEYYSITVPTGFYIANVKDNVKGEIDISRPIFKWKKERKIPFDCLETFLRTAVNVYRKYKSEFAGCIFHNTKKDWYEVLIPKQNISSTSVEYSPSDGFSHYEDMEDKNLIVDMHSHHVMGIGFSSTDNYSDSIIGAVGSISLVVKNIDKFNLVDFNKSVDIRVNIQGKSYPILIEDIFDTTDGLFNLSVNKCIEKKNNEKKISNIPSSLTYNYSNPLVGLIEEVPF